MQLRINSERVKLVKIPHGIYLKTEPPYRYMVVKLPINVNVLNEKEQYFFIDVSVNDYKSRKLYRFEDEYLKIN